MLIEIPEHMTVMIIFGTIALFLMGAGAYIWSEKAIQLLQNLPAGVTVRDRDGLARWAGIFLILMGCAWLFVGFCTWKYQETPYELVPLIISIPLMYLSIVVFLVRSQRFIH